MRPKSRRGGGNRVLESKSYFVRRLCEEVRREGSESSRVVEREGEFSGEANTRGVLRAAPEGRLEEL